MELKDKLIRRLFLIGEKQLEKLEILKESTGFSLCSLVRKGIDLILIEGEALINPRSNQGF